MHQLPRTSRVNDRIIEYYAKFGRDRDLDKFMRLYSPANTESTKSRSSGSNSCEDIILGIRRLFEDARHAHHVSSCSLPNMELDQQEAGDINIPIHVEGREKLSASAKEILTHSAEQLETPKKTQQETSTKETQTPESIGKSHKRLEWDSLGDVGYKKSMSTSNISVLERSLLRELFHEHSSTSASSHSRMANASDGDLKRLQGGMNQQPIPAPKYNTPPLASSTFVEGTLQGNTGAKPKVRTQSQGTSTSLLKKYEKYAQTSIQRPQLATQEVQVNMSSTTTSAMGSSATPSSFEYYTSHSSHSTGTTSNDDFKSSRCKSVQQHPFVAGINEMLARRKALVERNSQNMDSSSSAQQYDATALEELHETIKQALDENKENNNTHTSLLLRSPQLDLGIQLLCSLIDARSLTSKRKKQLVREIVKRISRLSVEDDNELSNSKPTTQHSSVNSTNRSAKPNRKHSKNIIKTLGEQPQSATENTLSNVVEGNLIQVDVLKKPSQPETSAKALANLALMKTQAEEKEQKTKLVHKPDKIREELQMKSTKTTATTTNKMLQSDKKVGTEISPTVSAHTEVSSTTTTSSKEIITQKAANESNTDTEQATMREWLNPMTQSEIEYEEKKRVHAQKEKRKGNKERDVQLNWIDCEIQRLESLRHLLLKQNGSSISATIKDHKEKQTKAKASTTKNDEKMYDTVCSDTNTSSVLSENAERIVQEIEVIIEESDEDVVNFESKLKRTKERKRETQIIYDKPTTEGDYNTLAQQGKPRFRTVKETVITNEEQVLDTDGENTNMATGSASDAQPRQRSKIDTPPSTSNDSESVGSFVQQRKREFLEQYKNKRKSHQEALLQQQRLQYQQQQQRQRDRYNRPSTLAAPFSHYAVPPHSMSHHTYPMSHHPNYNNFQHYPPPPPPPHYPQRTHVLHTNHSATMARRISAQGNQQYSASSVSVSSEISIPMDSNATSSTPTTTHQYDDVAAAAGTAIGSGIGVQTTDSLLRSQPIFGQREHGSISTITWRIPYSNASGQVPACVQVKPKPIAYVIHFDEKSNENSSDTTINQVPSVKVQEQDTDTLTLQEHLERARPEFLAQSKERKAILNQLQSLRQEREREMRQIVENTSLNSLDRNLRRLPPPPTKQIRVFPTKEMKAMTSKHVANLPEVLQRKQREREEKHRMGNRILREVFNRRLQRRVRNGKLSLNHSRTVI